MVTEFFESSENQKKTSGTPSLEKSWNFESFFPPFQVWSKHQLMVREVNNSSQRFLSRNCFLFFSLAKKYSNFISLWKNNLPKNQ